MKNKYLLGITRDKICDVSRHQNMNWQTLWRDISFFIRLQSNLEYERYLKEVVSALESDPDFRQKLDNATEIDVRVSREKFQSIICWNYNCKFIFSLVKLLTNWNT